MYLYVQGLQLVKYNLNDLVPTNYFDMVFCLNKIVLTYCEKKKMFKWFRKILKFEAEGREFAKVLRSLEQFIQTVKGQKIFW